MATKQKSVPHSRHKKPRNPYPKLPPVEHRFKSRAELGGALDPRINRSGRIGATLMSAAYKAWLAEVNANDRQGRTNAEIGAAAMGVEMFRGNVQAAREIRSATEGDEIRVSTWRDTVIGLLKDGRITAQAVSEELGDDVAIELIVAAGIPAGESGRPNQEGAAPNNDTVVAPAGAADTGVSE